MRREKVSGQIYITKVKDLMKILITKRIIISKANEINIIKNDGKTN